MKLNIILILAILCMFSGCSNHYYKFENNNFYIFLKNSDAKEVFFASSLDEFHLRKAEKIDSKTWVIKMPPDKEFRYFYMLDDEYFLPQCKFKEYDDFGSENCIFLPGM